MELSASQFLEHVTKGEPVAGARVSGQLIIAKGVQVLQRDWSDCQFDSSIELTECVFPDKAGGEEANRRAVLDLSGARVDGRIHIHGMRRCGLPQPTCNQIDVLLHGAQVEGELLVAAAEGGALLSLNFRGAMIAGQVLARGSFKRIDGRDSKVGGRLGIQLPPVRLWPEQDDQTERGFLESVAIDVSRANVAGDVEIVPDEESVAKTFGRPEHIEGVPAAFDILVLVDAERIRVGGDFLLGIPISDDAEASNWESLLSHGINLRRAEILGEATLRDVRIVSVEPLEENSHLYVGVAARKLRCGSLIISNLVFDLDIREEYGVDQGEIVRLVELDDAEIHDRISLSRVRGRVQTLPDSWRGPSVWGISMARVECESLDLNAPAIIHFNAGHVSLLPIEADGIKVSGAAEFSLREKLDTWASPEFRDAAETIKNSLGSELIPEASAQGAVIGYLDLVADPPVREKIDLTGAQVGKWKIGFGGQEEENSKNFLALLEATKGLDVGLYLAVEKRLEDIGKRSDADDVHVAWQRRRRKERLFSQSKPRWLLSWLHDAALGYGTRTWRPAFAILAAFLVSSILVFAYHAQWVQVTAQTHNELASCGAPCAERTKAILGEKDSWRRAREAVALSVKSLIPVIDLQIAPGLEAVPGTLGAYWLLLLRMIGIVAWPVLLAGSLARIIHKRNLG